MANNEIGIISNEGNILAHESYILSNEWDLAPFSALEAK